jgi:fatty acid desaturase
MKDDPIIQELRRIRKDIEEECKRKGQCYFDYLLEVQEKFKDRLVDEPLDYKEMKKKSA